MTTIRILGLDPSLTHTGYAVADVDCERRKIVSIIEMGTIVTATSKVKQVRKSSDKLERARTVAQALRDVIERHQIKLASSEIPSGAQSANAASAFGIVIGLLASLPVPILEVSPREVKLAVNPKSAGSVDKEDIVRWAVEITRARGGMEFWKTSKAPNDWGIMVGDRYVQVNQEHQADAVAGIQAAINTEQFRQLAGILAAHLG